jgi:hypothetical protein
MGKVIWYYSNLNGRLDGKGGAYLSLLLSGVPIALWGWRIMRASINRYEKERHTFWFLVSFSMIPGVITFFASWTMEQPVWHDRGLLIATLPFVILTAAAVGQLTMKWLRCGVYALLLLNAMWSTHHQLTEVAGRKLPWDGLARSVSDAEKREGSRINLYALRADWGYCLAFYLHARQDSRFKVLSVKGALARKVSEPVFLKKFPSVRAGTFLGFGDDHFWLMFAENDWPRKGSQPQDLLKKVGYEMDSKIQDSQKRLTLISVSRRQSSKQKHVLNATSEGRPEGTL